MTYASRRSGGTHPGEAVKKVQVFDNVAERLLWQAFAPRSVAGRRGEATLWGASDGPMSVEAIDHRVACRASEPTVS
ncbi:hypothetical protein OG936_20970 [Streptomyces sp. NBC_00846]|uniref:hypothetical protein n=1 Tax=Streptomyces sp. NBC_00846 TaxID=2975849 RepID=UPI00386AE61C|nr:hypothetical protein OG936_20970 [Streptomyces sp. NBC_00846]